MKTIKLIILALITFLLFFAGCIVQIVSTAPATATATATAADPSLIKLIAGAVLGIYEVVVRIVPSVGDYSIVSWLLKALKKVSDTLNITKST